jgi:DNA-binding NarL/FixJ family response regulator
LAVKLRAYMTELELKDKPTAENARNPVRVFLLSADRLLCQMLPTAFKRQPSILLVGTHSSSPDVVAEILESACDVLLVDISNDANSLEIRRLLATLKHMHPYLKSVIMSMDHGIADLIACIQASCTGGRARMESAQRAV